MAGTDVFACNTAFPSDCAGGGGGAPSGPAGGDLSGTYPNPTVSGLQGNAISGAAPAAGNVLSWNAGTSQWEPVAAPPASLSYWIESQDAAGVNATVPVSQWQPVAGTTDADAVINPKGTGSILAQIPDGSTTGGDKRGINSVDFQKVRAGSTEVASGDTAFIGNGGNNTAYGYVSAVVNGVSNNVRGQFGAIVGGYNNYNEPDGGFIGGGQQHQIRTGANLSVIGGGNSNTISDNSYNSAVVGGQNNLISNDSNNSFIGGGNTNTIFGLSPYNTIGGGHDIIVAGSENVIAGGWNNYTQGYAFGERVQWSNINGGATNNISVKSAGSSDIRSSVIGGGAGNVIQTDNVAAAGAGVVEYATIGGGNGNTIANFSPFYAYANTIAGGSQNSIVDSVKNFIGGGEGNSINGDPAGGGEISLNTIAGGEYNQMNIAFPGDTVKANFIGGGSSNTMIGAEWSVIAGGNQNQMNGDLVSHSNINGGYGNIIQYNTNRCVIGGGEQNNIQGQLGIVNYATIGGGRNNNIINNGSADLFGNTVAGGQGNINNGLPYQTIGGGYNNNLINSTSATIVGGETNSIDNGASAVVGGSHNNLQYTNNSIIAGGYNNLISNASDGCTISGGVLNDITAIYSTIGGGYDNNVSIGSSYNDSQCATIAGGARNNIGGINQTAYATIGGGEYNEVHNNHAVVPGGFYAKSRNTGGMYNASGKFNAAGDAQAERVTWRTLVTDADNVTHYQLYIDGATEQYVLPPGSLCSFTLNIQVIDMDTETVGSCSIQGTAHCNYTGTVRIVGTHKDNYSDPGSWICDIDIDAGAGAIYPYVQINQPYSSQIRATATGYFTFLRYDT